MKPGDQELADDQVYTYRNSRSLLMSGIIFLFPAFAAFALFHADFSKKNGEVSLFVLTCVLVIMGWLCLSQIALFLRERVILTRDAVRRDRPISRPIVIPNHEIIALHQEQVYRGATTHFLQGRKDKISFSRFINNFEDLERDLKKRIPR